MYHECSSHSTPTKGQVTVMTKEYLYEGTKFTVSKPDDCVMEVSANGFTAKVVIHEATNMYRESLDGWGQDHNTLDAALDSACKRILKKSASPSKEQLCAGMDKFYDSLEK